MSTTTAPRRGNEKPRLLATASVPLLKSHANLLGGLDVVWPRLVAWPHLHHGVGSIGGDQPDRSGGDLHRGRNRLRGIESGHVFSFVG